MRRTHLQSGLFAALAFAVAGISHAAAAPDCKPSEVSIKSSDVGDVAMSQQLTAYLIEYKGSGTCRLHGYPNVVIIDEKGKEQPGLVEFVGETFFAKVATPPQPVTLSQSNKNAWFAVEYADACGDTKPQPRKAKIALPHSRDWLHTIQFPVGTCKGVEVTPIAPHSTLHSSVH